MSRLPREVVPSPSFEVVRTSKTGRNPEQPGLSSDLQCLEQEVGLETS